MGGQGKRGEGDKALRCCWQVVARWARLVSDRSAREQVLTCLVLLKTRPSSRDAVIGAKWASFFLWCHGCVTGKILTCCDVSHCPLFRPIQRYSTQSEEKKTWHATSWLSEVDKSGINDTGKHDHTELTRSHVMQTQNICCEVFYFCNISSCWGDD